MTSMINFDDDPHFKTQQLLQERYDRLFEKVTNAQKNNKPVYVQAYTDELTQVRQLMYQEMQLYLKRKYGHIYDDEKRFT